MNKETSVNGNLLSFDRDSEFYLTRGYERYEKHDNFGAIKLLRRGMELYPYDKDLPVALATVYSNMQLYELSTRTLLKYFPDISDCDSNVLFLLGCNHYSLENYDPAYDILSTYLDLYPNEYHAAYVNDILASIEEMDYDDGESIKLLDNNSQNDEKLNDCYIRGNRLVSENKLKEAIEVYKNGLEKLQDRNNILRNNLAVAYFCIGDYNNALIELEKISKDSPKDPYMHCSLALYYHTKKMIPQLKDELIALKSIKTDDRDVLYRLSITYIQLSLYSDCVVVLKKLLLADMYNNELLHKLGICYYNLHEYESSARCYGLILKIDDCDSIAAYYYKLCIDAQKKGKTSKMPVIDYQVPPREVIRRMSYIQDCLQSHVTEIKELFENDRRFFMMTRWALEYDDVTIKQIVIAMLSSFKSRKAELMLRDFLLREDQPYMLKSNVCRVLIKNGHKPPFPMNIDGRYVNTRVDFVSVSKSFVPKCLRNIMDILTESLARVESQELLRVAMVIWSKFVDSTDIEKMTKEREVALAAAIDSMASDILEMDFSDDEAVEFYDITKLRLKNARAILEGTVDAQEIAEELGLDT